MTEAVAELVAMAREADACRMVSMQRRRPEAVWNDGMTAMLCMEAARRLAKKHGLPRPWLNEELKGKYRMELTL